MNIEANGYFRKVNLLAIVRTAGESFRPACTSRERAMTSRLTLFGALLLATTTAFAFPFQSHLARAATAVREDGIVKVKSAYGFHETISRIKADIAGKGIAFFLAVDQTRLGENAGIKLQPSTLLIFGNPPLGIQFLTSNPDSGLDWPVRLLVRQDNSGQVWAVYTDFAWIAKRHGITDREGQFKMASNVIASITSSVTSKP
jgi:uncharacterized protein (DUF302 family)